MGELCQNMAQELAIKNHVERTQEQGTCLAARPSQRPHVRSPRAMGLSEITDYPERLVVQGTSPEKLSIRYSVPPRQTAEYARACALLRFSTAL